VTADELPTLPGDAAPRLGMRASVNGRRYSDSNLGDLYWSFTDMISYASRGTEVRPGDIIGSGTVGTGCIADLAARHGPDQYRGWRSEITCIWRPIGWAPSTAF
jgi:2-keto-4-pentenoate hydratase/2-oxohepta-3-ene-1,7-dioic acid hydratase in catechol pathway